MEKKRQQKIVIDLVKQPPLSALQLYKKEILQNLTNKTQNKNRNHFMSFKQFQTIYQIWYKKMPKASIVKEKQQIPMNLTYYNLKKLSFGYCLNDQVINSYLSLLNQKFQKKEKQYIIFDSLATIYILGFQKTFQRIKKSFVVKNVCQNSQLIFVLNFSKHWFFVVANSIKMYIYDSLIKTIKYYLSIDLIVSLKSILDKFYNCQHQIQICQSFPQQQNNHDCGVMMLLGIKDVIKNQFMWTFNEKKARMFRPKIAYQLLNQEIKEDL